MAAPSAIVRPAALAGSPSGPSASPRARRSASVFGGRGHGSLRDVAVRVVAVHRQRLAGREHRRRREIRAGRGPDRRLEHDRCGAVRGPGRRRRTGGLCGRHELRGVRIGSDRDGDGRRRPHRAVGAGKGLRTGHGNGPRRRLRPARGRWRRRVRRGRCGGDRRGDGRLGRLRLVSGSGSGDATSSTTGSSPVASQPSSATSTGSTRSGASAGGAGSGTTSSTGVGVAAGAGAKERATVATAATTAPHDEHEKRPASTGDSHSGQTTTFVAIVQPRSKHPF